MEQQQDRRRSSQWQRMKDLGWVTVRQAARIARREPRTVYRWIADKTFEGRQIGKTWYVSTKSLHKVLGPLADVDPESEK